MTSTSPANTRTQALIAIGDRKYANFVKTVLAGLSIPYTHAANPTPWEKIGSGDFQMIILDQENVSQFAKYAHEIPNSTVVLIASQDDVPFIQLHKTYPFLSHIIRAEDLNRPTAVHTLRATLGKTGTKDFFGIEKYLGWGTQIREETITSSNREPVLAALEAHLALCGLRESQILRCLTVAEEMLLNAIYDAPVDSEGAQRYHPVQRTTPLKLDSSEYATLRYGSDGSILAISVKDVFGRLDRDTVLNYVSSRMAGEDPPGHEGKSGGGYGLHIILKGANLTVFNVQEGKATEVIALIELPQNRVTSASGPEFQFFNAGKDSKGTPDEEK